MKKEVRAKIQEYEKTIKLTNYLLKRHVESHVLTVSYFKTFCAGCKNYRLEFDFNGKCFHVDSPVACKKCEPKLATDTYDVFFYHVEPGKIQMVTTDFEEIEISNVQKVTDVDSGKTLYEKRK